jgi:hypothetical protein
LVAIFVEIGAECAGGKTRVIDKPENFTNSSKERKPYAVPVLQVYGDFREITNSSTHTGSKADDAHPTPRTK